MQMTTKHTYHSVPLIDSTENQEPVVTIDNNVHQCNQNPKLLGVRLVENSISGNILK